MTSALWAQRSATELSRRDPTEIRTPFPRVKTSDPNPWTMGPCYWAVIPFGKSPLHFVHLTFRVIHGTLPTQVTATTFFLLNVCNPPLGHLYSVVISLPGFPAASSRLLQGFPCDEHETPCSYAGETGLSLWKSYMTFQDTPSSDRS